MCSHEAGVRSNQCYNTLQHTAKHCNTLQSTATHCTTCSPGARAASHQCCNVLQNTATHSSTLQHTATRTHLERGQRAISAATCCYYTVQHNAARCSTLQHILIWSKGDEASKPLLCTWTRESVNFQWSKHTATHYNTLHHTATHCNTLQHTATRAHLERGRRAIRALVRMDERVRQFPVVVCASSCLRFVDDFVRDWRPYSSNVCVRNDSVIYEI